MADQILEAQWEEIPSSDQNPGEKAAQSAEIPEIVIPERNINPAISFEDLETQLNSAGQKDNSQRQISREIVQTSPDQRILRENIDKWSQRTSQRLGESSKYLLSDGKIPADDSELKKPVSEFIKKLTEFAQKNKDAYAQKWQEHGIGKNIDELRLSAEAFAKEYTKSQIKGAQKLGVDLTNKQEVEFWFSTNFGKDHVFSDAPTLQEVEEAISQEMPVEELLKRVGVAETFEHIAQQPESRPPTEDQSQSSSASEDAQTASTDAQTPQEEQSQESAVPLEEPNPDEAAEIDSKIKTAPESEDLSKNESSKEKSRTVPELVEDYLDGGVIAGIDMFFAMEHGGYYGGNRRNMSESVSSAESAQDNQVFQVIDDISKNKDLQKVFLMDILGVSQENLPKNPSDLMREFRQTIDLSDLKGEKLKEMNQKWYDAYVKTYAVAAEKQIPLKALNSDQFVLTTGVLQASLDSLVANYSNESR